jgi:hypothetical protein
MIRAVHTAIYVVTAASTFVFLYGGITGRHGWRLRLGLGLLIVESIVLVDSGMKCPLTAMAVQYGASTGHVFDTFLPERFTRHTFRFFGSVMAVSLLLLAACRIGLLR